MLLTEPRQLIGLSEGWLKLKRREGSQEWISRMHNDCWWMIGAAAIEWLLLERITEWNEVEWAGKDKAEKKDCGCSQLMFSEMMPSIALIWFQPVFISDWISGLMAASIWNEIKKFKLKKSIKQLRQSFPEENTNQSINWTQSINENKLHCR